MTTHVDGRSLKCHLVRPEAARPPITFGAAAVNKLNVPGALTSIKRSAARPAGGEQGRGWFALGGPASRLRPDWPAAAAPPTSTEDATRREGDRAMLASRHTPCCACAHTHGE